MKQNACKTANQKPHIRTKLTLAFTLYTTVALACLLLFQTLCMEEVYEFIKIRGIKNATHELVASIHDDEVEELAEYWTDKEQCRIYIADSDGTIMFNESAGATDMPPLSSDFLKELYTKTDSNGGTYFVTSFVYEKDAHKEDDRGKVGMRDIPPEGRVRRDDTKLILYAAVDEDDGQHIVVVLSRLTPVDATVRTLYVQFLLAAVVVIGFAGLLAVFFSRYMTRPIENINRAAKTLSGSCYEPPAVGGYREVEELRETLAQVAIELKKSEQLQRDILANVSHDLRTPLTMITGYSEAIRDLPGEDSAENIQVVIDEAARLTRLVNDVLDLSKLQSGAQVLDKTAVDITGLVQDVVDRCTRMIEHHGYHISFVYDRTVTVSGDTVRISQVIYNLLLNAIAHTGEDRLVTVRQEIGNGEVCIAVEDSGSGIPDSEKENIWIRYYRAENKLLQGTANNTGLGLSIVQAIVAMHGGQCGVRDREGGGSVFWFTLPTL